MKKILIIWIALGLLTLFIAACTGGGTSSSLSSSSTSKAGASAPAQPDTVHMSDSQFVQNTITIKKGASLTLIDDSPNIHVISNGTWQSNGIPKYALETGAPKIDTQFSGNDRHQIGPFATAGTFHLYCTIHQGMTLTVIVQ